MPCSGKKNVRGFTLLELLIVITIIGLVIGLVSLSTGLIGNVPLEREAKRLHALIDQVGKEAIIQSKVIGIHFSHNNYSFLQLQDNQWQVLSDDDIFKTRELPEQLKLEHDFETDEESETLKPMTFFLPTGETLPFIVALRDIDSNEKYIITLKHNGTVAMERVDE
ncbi:MAG: type II secretion system minor pseudopilin GspH, partial [Gammaproteobacteria bacterium]|nr:type II secretion system minor pseudopilin GspH [Gammaproteobacteria bacterium]MDH5614124.1 type II secretion system minor pseudopilin GspH [Gammaproteobacteria bacterium]